MKPRNRNRYIILFHYPPLHSTSYVIKDSKTNDFYHENGELVLFLTRESAYAKCRELNNSIPNDED
jgi:hypothetical protein